jgi:hypothetical protein
MSDRETIAAIIPAHPNRLRNGMYDRALRSVCMQTLPPDMIHTVVDLEGQGAPATRDRALRAATTDWVAFLDSDDMWYQQHLEHLYRHAKETKADYVYSWFELLGPGDQLYGDHDPIFPPTHFSEPFDPENPIETTITILVRNDLAQEIGFQALARGEVNTGEDRRFTLEAIKLGANIQHLVERTWIWHHHGGNSSGIHGKGDTV